MGLEEMDCRRGAGLSMGGLRGRASKSAGMEKDLAECERNLACATSSREARNTGVGLISFLVGGLCDTGISLHQVVFFY